jgi:hypothetical protein
LRKHITVRNGAFFSNEQGKLSGYQTLTVRKARDLVGELNRLIEVEGRSAAGPGRPAMR